MPLGRKYLEKQKNIENIDIVYSLRYLPSMDAIVHTVHQQPEERGQNEVLSIVCKHNRICKQNH